MAYEPINWQDLPSEETPIDADNLNHMDAQIKANADAIALVPTEQEIADLKILGWTVPKECPIQNYVDDNGVFHQKVGRVVLNGSENWTTSSGRYVVSCASVGLPNTVNSAYSEKYNYGTSTKGSFRISTNVLIYDTDYDGSTVNLTAFKSKLASSPLVIFYELSTEITFFADGNEATTNQMLSDEWKSTTTYAQGDFAIYKNKLWKSKVASNLNHAPEEGSYWTETTIGKEVSNPSRLDISSYFTWTSSAIDASAISAIYIPTLKMVMLNGWIHITQSTNLKEEIQIGTVNTLYKPKNIAPITVSATSKCVANVGSDGRILCRNQEGTVVLGYVNVNCIYSL